MLNNRRPCWRSIGNDIASADCFDDELCREVDVAFILASVVPKDLKDSVVAKFNTPNVWAISVKSFGDSNGVVYNKPRTPEYYDIHMPIQKHILQQYDYERDLWGDRFIDMLGPLMDKNRHVRVFTDNKKYISQDCRHLTKDGAQFYARILPIQQYLVPRVNSH